MQNLPIGLQNFREIRENDYLYVDKTALIYPLTSSKYYFLSRPRRFGKSLLLSTIKELFSGSQDLFKGLWIENKWDWSQIHPVIHLKISSIDYQRLGLYDALSKELSEIALELGVTLKETALKGKFRELITKASVKGKVVILIDEYDKPIIDYLDDSTKTKENKDILKEFYSIIKDADPYIRFLLITGVSKFTKVSIFSDLNNLDDLTLHPKYTNLCGITQVELEKYFAEPIAELSASNPNIKEDIKNWYNGYSWDGVHRVYNPFSILRFMSTQSFHNFWFETGTPTFLIEVVTKRRQFNFSEVQTGLSGLSDFNTDNINPTTLLFQTGYLTIKEYNPKFQLYTLGYPNEEVRSSLLQYLIGAYRFENASESTPLVVQLYNALHEKNIEEIIAIINTAFATIPYDLWRGATELHYHALVHLTFSLLGTYMQSEVHSAKGRCDALIQTPQYIYALEFKLDESAEIALQQIEEKGYLTPYLQLKQEKIAIGINFSSEKKAVEAYLIKEFIS
jgi:Predicted AAA-ATPase/PD-(D/E)XK nuclease superfamily